MVKYIGSKRLLAPLIAGVAQRLPIRSVCDLFAGTTRVGQEMRRAGMEVHSNDLASYSEMLGLAYIAATDNDLQRVPSLLRHLQAIEPKAGYFTETFCEKSRFFRPENGMKVDAIRDEIDNLDLTVIERGALLTSLLEAADRVDSTCGLQMAYVKKWAKRAYNPLELRVPSAVQGPAGSVSRANANSLALDLGDFDCTYLDPPYNQHSYFSNYHIWETLVRWDSPEAYGVACKRIDCKTTKSDYNSKPRSWPAFARLIESVPTPWLIVSFNNEGFHDPSDVEALLSEKGYVRCVGVDFKRYVGAQIGIHNPSGEKVGKVSHLRNTEHLFIVGPDQELVDQVASAVPGSAGASKEQEALF